MKLDILIELDEQQKAKIKVLKEDLSQVSELLPIPQAMTEAINFLTHPLSTFHPSTSLISKEAPTPIHPLELKDGGLGWY